MTQTISDKEHAEFLAFKAGIEIEPAIEPQPEGDEKMKQWDKLKDSININPDDFVNFMKEEKQKIKNNEIIAIPREYMLLIGGGTALFIISIFPVILIGILIGMGVIARVGCKWFKA